MNLRLWRTSQGGGGALYYTYNIRACLNFI